MKNNMETFVKLIERYETITLQEIKDVMPVTKFYGEYASKTLTGFGTLNCTLCKAAFEISQENKPDINSHLPPSNCIYCVYETDWGCQEEGENEKSYYAIIDASCPEELLEAFRNRAKLMRRKYL